MNRFLLMMMVFWAFGLFAGDNCLYDRNRKRISEKREAREQYYLTHDLYSENDKEKQDDDDDIDDDEE